MTRGLLAAVAAPCMLVGSAFSLDGVKPPAQEQTMEDTAARSFWAALDEAWNTRQAARFAALFTADASFEIGGRDALSGRKVRLLRAFPVPEDGGAPASGRS